MEVATALEFVGARHWGVLLTIRDSNGRPQASNIAYALLDGELRISVTDDRAKTANLRADPRASLHVSSDDFWSWVVVECDTTISPVASEPGDQTTALLRELYTAVQGAEHDDWDEFDAAMVRQQRCALRLTPERAYGQLSS